LALPSLLAGLLVPTAASGQVDVFAPEDTGWQPGLDTLVVTASVRPEWQAFLVGDAGTSLFADFMLAGAPTSATSGLGLTGQAAGTWIFGGRADAVSTGVASLGLTLGWWFSHAALGLGGASDSWTPPPTLIGLSVAPYAHPRDEGDTNGVEVGLRVSRIDVPWGLEERNPTLSLAVFRDFGRLDAARVDVDLDLGLWIQNAALLEGRETGAHVEARLSWGQDPDGWDEAALGELDAWSWRAGLRAGIDWGLAAVLLRVGATDARNVRPRVFGELALRIWPDAAPL
jgi:hypothetical protein